MNDCFTLHHPICKKVFNKKHKPCSCLKQRLQGTETTTVKKEPPQKKQPEKKPNWRQYHEDFTNTAHSVKQVTKVLKEGHLLPHPPSPSICPVLLQQQLGEFSLCSISSLLELSVDRASSSSGTSNH
ncbi:PREDICTED: zinc finger C2HC domain-containing protein 1B [Buceros rhinoceros silvestris]|uniref:zinc finger C2HC domain-containing protein 1B n=1 Tax=Buceros rhinoceros silvestris TaxID=175836 RepID=UPI0005282BB4|nr:PREDICTED: zinc finger C2HC domain-containing protein 1B [Buceros rhinoceros silvestris]